METGQQIRREFDHKETDNKKTIQRLNEDIVSLTSELREEKKSSNRYQNELFQVKAEVTRLEDYIDQLKTKENVINENLSQLRDVHEITSDEAEKYKSEAKFKQIM